MTTTTEVGDARRLLARRVLLAAGGGSGLHDAELDVLLQLNAPLLQLGPKRRVELIRVDRLRLEDGYEGGRKIPLKKDRENEHDVGDDLPGELGESGDDLVHVLRHAPKEADGVHVAAEDIEDVAGHDGSTRAVVVRPRQDVRGCPADHVGVAYNEPNDASDRVHMPP